LGRIRIDPEAAPSRSASGVRGRFGSSPALKILLSSRILAHLKNKASYTEPAMLPDGRAPPPQAHLFDWTKKTINDLTALHASVQSGFYWTVGRHWAEIEAKAGGSKESATKWARRPQLGAPS
jgi:hypothetical protein